MSDDVTPVLFRADTENGTTYITAVFPTDPGTNDFGTMSCYAHIGQHGSCSLGWYRETRAAKPEEYEPLKRELEAKPYKYKFKIYRRIQPWMRGARCKALQP